MPGRLALELLAKIHGVHINGVGHMAWFEGLSDTALATWGLLWEVGYRFNRRWELASRFSRVALTNALRNDAKAYAAGQISIDPSSVRQYASVGERYSNNEAAMTGSFSIIGHSLKIQLEAAWEGADTELGLQQTFVSRLQFQLQY